MPPKRPTPRVVKRAVSMPAALDAAVSSLVRESGASYSGVVRVALEDFIASKREERLERLYADYYADPAVRERDRELIADLARLSAKSWQ